MAPANSRMKATRNGECRSLFTATSSVGQRSWESAADRRGEGLAAGGRTGDGRTGRADEQRAAGEEVWYAQSRSSSEFAPGRNSVSFPETRRRVARSWPLGLQAAKMYHSGPPAGPYKPK